MTMCLIQIIKELLQKQIFGSDLRKYQVRPCAETSNTSHFQALAPSLEGGSCLQEKQSRKTHRRKSWKDTEVQTQRGSTLQRTYSLRELESRPKLDLDRKSVV